MIADAIVQRPVTLATDTGYVVGIVVGVVLGAIGLFLYLSLRVWANTKFWGSFNRENKELREFNKRQAAARREYEKRRRESS